MTVRKRVHVIDPKKLRVDRSANDNLKKARKQARVRLIEPDEPVPASLARERLGLPHPAQFSKAGVLDLVIDRFLADDTAFESYQRKLFAQVS